MRTESLWIKNVYLILLRGFPRTGTLENTYFYVFDVSLKSDQAKQCDWLRTWLSRLRFMYFRERQLGLDRNPVPPVTIQCSSDAYAYAVFVI